MQKKRKNHVFRWPLGGLNNFQNEYFCFARIFHISFFCNEIILFLLLENQEILQFKKIKIIFRI